jgi:adenylate kinase family enzyme
MHRPGRRILTVGTCGCGKTFVARALSERLRIPYICNDAIIWGPNWTQIDDAERARRFDLATNIPAWTLDGNISSMRHAEDPLILSRAETVIWLDLPRRQVYPALLWRTVRRSLLREELWHGNRETFGQSFASRDSILLWAYRTFPKYRTNYTRLFASDQAKHVNLIHLRSRAQVRRLLADAEPAAHLIR